MAAPLGPKGDMRRRGVLSVVFKTPEMHIPPWYWFTCPTPQEDTPLETLAYVGGSRWRIETEFETEKSDVCQLQAKNASKVTS